MAYCLENIWTDSGLSHLQFIYLEFNYRKHCVGQSSMRWICASNEQNKMPLVFQEELQDAVTVEAWQMHLSWSNICKKGRGGESTVAPTLWIRTKRLSVRIVLSSAIRNTITSSCHTATISLKFKHSMCLTVPFWLLQIKESIGNDLSIPHNESSHL